MLNKEVPFIVVDDSEHDVRLFQRVVNQQGLEPLCLVAHDVQEALRIVCSRDVSLIVLDLRLPRISGHEAIVKFREAVHPSVPIVVFSSSDNKMDIDRAFRLGANSYIKKPVTLDEYGVVVSALLNYWLKIDFRGSHLPLSLLEVSSR